MKRAVLWWLVVLIWCSLIFVSSATPSFNASSTERFVAEQVAEEHTPTVNFVARKAAHIVIFGLLAVFLAEAMVMWPAPKRSRRWATLITVLIAASDEMHQFLVPGRAGSLSDVALDSFAAILAVTLHARAGRLLPVRSTNGTQ